MSDKNKVIQVSNTDIAAVFTSLGGDRNQLFMFENVMNLADLDHESSPSDVLNNKELIEMCRRLSHPDVMLNIINGGIGKPIDILKVFTNNGLEGGIAVQKLKDGYSLFEINDIRVLAPTHGYAFGTKMKNQMENLIKNEMDMDSLIFMMHLIDTYRRITYRNLLNYRSETSLTIAVDIFMDVFAESLKKRDARWLLPTFVFFTEIFNKYETELTQEKLQQLVKFELISLETNAEGKGLIRFEEKGRLLALEFYKYLKNCTCIMRKEVHGSDVQESDLVFIAHTELTNHYFEINITGKQCGVKHDNITLEALVGKFSEIFEK